MKKAVKVLLGIATAGAMASAVALAVKKYKDSRKKYVCDEFEECDDDYFDEESDAFDDEYHLTPEEEEELISTDDHDFGTSDDDYYPGKYADISILEKEEVAFIKYILEGIRNVGYLMNVKFEDIERLCRRRNISNSEKLEQIRAICVAGKDNNDLFDGCIEDISDMVSENIPEDFWDFLEDYTKKKEDDNDAE